MWINIYAIFCIWLQNFENRGIIRKKSVILQEKCDFFMQDVNFSNDLILLEQIPEVAQANFTPLESAYLKVQRITIGIFFLVMLLGAGAVFFFNPKIQIWWVMLATVGVLLLFLGVAWVLSTWSFQCSGYALRTHDLLYKSGWWWRTLKVVPFNRAQHLSLESGLIERQYGLASLRIYTAGASQADFSLYGVKQEVAEKLKDWISAHIQRQNTLPAITTDTETEIMVQTATESDPLPQNSTDEQSNA